MIREAIREAVREHLETHPVCVPAPTFTQEPEGPRYYTRKEAAAVAQISLPTLHQLHNEGLIPFVKIGRSTRILADKFDADLAAGKFSNLRKRHRA